MSKAATGVGDIKCATQVRSACKLSLYNVVEKQVRVILEWVGSEWRVGRWRDAERGRKEKEGKGGERVRGKEANVYIREEEETKTSVGRSEGTEKKWKKWRRN